MELSDVKAYLRVDTDEDDGLIQALMDAAEEYLAGAGIVESAGNRARYALAVKGLCLHWYDFRGDAAAGTAAVELPTGLRAVINQLKLECL
ncbi:MAG: phage gp6-like head-tail connector protein [Oscillospiraceae bacterium]|nr:phage gp6-like head-tail connector protein [Oscillospiraceae bacterium]